MRRTAQCPGSDMMRTSVPGSEEGALEVIGRSLLLLGQSPRKLPHSALHLLVKMKSFIWLWETELFIAAPSALKCDSQWLKGQMEAATHITPTLRWGVWSVYSQNLQNFPRCHGATEAAKTTPVAQTARGHRAGEGGRSQVGRPSLGAAMMEGWQDTGLPRQRRAGPGPQQTSTEHPCLKDRESVRCSDLLSDLLHSGIALTHVL